ncbi:MAG: IS110 family transposase [Caldithrix sp.]|nr:IS110 family transposase [Caldithrix sp.]
MKLKIKEPKFNSNTLLVTMDVGKKLNYGYARCKNGTSLPVFTFSNTGEGFRYLLNKVEQFRRKKGLRKLLFGLESTGSYGQALIYFLYKRGFDIVQINPMHTKRVKEIQDNSPNKTDKKDPKVIADIIELNRYLSLIIPEGASADLRGLIHLREHKLDDITRIYNRIESQLYLIFPEFLSVMKTLKTKTALYLIKHYPTPQALCKLGLKKLIHEIERISRKQLGNKKAEDLYHAALSSAGITDGAESIIDGIQMHLNELELYQTHKDELENKIDNKLKAVPYSQRILSVRGIGVITTAAIIGEVGDLKQYQSNNEVLKVAGLNLYEISSGQHKGERHISKRGRSLLRKTLYFAALNVTRKDGILHDKYHSYIERGMLKNKALTAISRKLMGIIFALVRDNVNYIEGYKVLSKVA